MNPRILVIVSACSIPVTAVAAPFCAVTAAGANCFYYDVQSCRQAAGTAGACVVNSGEVQSDSATRQRSGIRFSTVKPAIDTYQQGIREGDRQRAEDQLWELRQLEIEQRRRDLAR